MIRKFYSTEGIAAFVSVVFHLILLLITFPKLIKDPVQPDYRIPVKMVVVEVPVETPKVRKPKSESKKLITKKPLALAKKTVSKPAALPGDRPEPILTNDIVPVYPKQALNNEWEGQVEVSVEVDATGKPIRVSVISSSGHPILDQAFVRTIQELYTFKPKREGGKDVSGTKRLSYTYKLQ